MEFACGPMLSDPHELADLLMGVALDLLEDEDGAQGIGQPGEGSLERNAIHYRLRTLDGLITHRSVEGDLPATALLAQNHERPPCRHGLEPIFESAPSLVGAQRLRQAGEYILEDVLGILLRLGQPERDAVNDAT